MSRLAFLALCAASALANQCGCAITVTAALGKDARAALAQPVCSRAYALDPAGLRVTDTEHREGKIGPDDVTATKVTEPAFEPAPEPSSVSIGSDVGEGIAGVFRGIGLFFRALVPW